MKRVGVEVAVQDVDAVAASVWATSRGLRPARSR